MTSSVRDQPALKTPVTIGNYFICPGQRLARYFPRTEEARGSNPLTSTREAPSNGGCQAHTGIGPPTLDACRRTKSRTDGVERTGDEPPEGMVAVERGALGETQAGTVGGTSLQNHPTPM